MEYRYSTKCPAHGQNLETKRTQSFKYNGVTYNGPSFYCTRCKKYYLIIEGNPPFSKLKSTAASGLPIDIRKGVVKKELVKKKGVKVEQPKQKNILRDETKPKKTSESNKNKAARKALIEKNKESKKRLQKSVNQIRCEMNCPNHVDRVMTTKNCVDVEKYKNLPLFYCIDCKKYYVACADLKVMQLGRWNKKDFFNCDCEIRTTNSANGKLTNIGSFSSTAKLEKVISTENGRKEQYIEKSVETIQESNSDSIQKSELEKQRITTEIEVVKPREKGIKIVESLIEKKKTDAPKEIAKKISSNKSLVFDEWSFEDTEDELFKDFIQKN